MFLNMTTETSTELPVYRQKKLIIEVAPELYAALQAEASRQSTASGATRRVSITEVVRVLIHDHLTGDASVPSALQ